MVACSLGPPLAVLQGDRHLRRERGDEADLGGIEAVRPGAVTAERTDDPRRPHAAARISAPGSPARGPPRPAELAYQFDVLAGSPSSPVRNAMLVGASCSPWTSSSDRAVGVDLRNVLPGQAVRADRWSLRQHAPSGRNTVREVVTEQGARGPGHPIQQLSVTGSSPADGLADPGQRVQPAFQRRIALHGVCLDITAAA